MNMRKINCLAVVAASTTLSACTSDWNAPDPVPATELEVVREIPVSWPVQCFDADFKYEDPEFQVHCGSEYDNMSIEIEDDGTVTLRNNPDPDFKEDEYRNAFLLSNPLPIPDNGDMLVVRGRMTANNVEGSTGLWVHLAELFDEHGSILNQGEGFVGGAAGIGYTGNKSAESQQGWRIGEAEGWGVSFLTCYLGDTGLKNGDLIEMRITPKTTQFIINNMLVEECSDTFEYERPELTFQLWLDNFTVSRFFDVGYADIESNQSAVYNDIAAFIAREK